MKRQVSIFVGRSQRPSAVVPVEGSVGIDIDGGGRESLALRVLPSGAFTVKVSGEDRYAGTLAETEGRGAPLTVSPAV